MSGADHIEAQEGSGNVFADLGFDAPTAAKLSHKPVELERHIVEGQTFLDATTPSR